MSGSFTQKKVQKPLLSVVVPVSKMTGQLGNLGNWLSNIWNYPIEVIVVHDKCDETTGVELVELLNRVDSKNIVYIEGEFNSPGLARNAGMELATGDWLAFWDSDDIPHVSNVVEAIDSLGSNSLTIVGKFKAVENKTGIALWESPAFNDSDDLQKIFESPGVWRMIFKRNQIKKTKFREFHMGEDQLFLIESAALDKDVVFSNLLLYSYYIGVENQLTSQKSKISEIPKVITAISQLEKEEWTKLDLRLISKMILTSLFKGKLSVKFKTIKAIFALYRHLGTEKSLQLFKFQMGQLLHTAKDYLRILRGKL
jgi:glycosyltransferase involved in cell wall biosynthesis